MGIFAWRNLLTRPLRTMLALIGLSIPILGILGLFCLSNGLRDLVGTTLSRIEGLIILREDVPSPVFSRLPASLGRRAPANAGRPCRRSRGLGARPRDRRPRHAASKRSVRQGNELDLRQAGDRRPGHCRASESAKCCLSAGHSRRMAPAGFSSRATRASSGW